MPRTCPGCSQRVAVNAAFCSKCGTEIKELSEPTQALPPPGWYVDPDGGTGRRWWDGRAWTEHRETPEPQPPPPDDAADESSEFRDAYPHPGPMPKAAYKGPVPKRLVAMGKVAGRTRDEIVGALGPPNSISATGGHVLLQWQRITAYSGSYHYALIFDTDGVCGGITHQSTH